MPIKLLLQHGCLTSEHDLFVPIHVLLEDQMTESNKLIALRDKLVGRRRAIVESLQAVSSELLTGHAIARIQNAIDAVDRAIVEERRAESNVGESPRRVPSTSQRPSGRDT
jgi:hypothetical protein